MAVSYKKLWHMLLDLGMKKKDLQDGAGLTPHAMRKLSRNEAITTDTIAKLCKFLNCKADDIMDFPDIDIDR